MDEKVLAKRVLDWGYAHREELVKDLIQLVNIKSVSQPGEGGYAFGTGCRNCAEAAMKLACGYGFETENDEDYTISIISRGTSDKELGILGHLDVVPEGNGWKYAPYDAIEKDGFMIGRGSSDNKGGVVMSLYAMRCMKELGINLDHTVRLICGFNEESGMEDVTHYIKTHKQLPQYTLVCDGGWAMTVGEKGILTADLKQEIHSGNLVEFTGGIASNSVPDHALVKLRNVPRDKLEELKRQEPALRVTQDGNLTCIEAAGKAMHAFVPQYGINAIYLLLRALCRYDLLSGDAAAAVQNLALCFPDDFGTGLNIRHSDSFPEEIVVLGPADTTVVGGMIRFENGVLTQNINVRYAINQNSDALLRSLKETCAQRHIRIENLEYSGPRYSSLEDPVTRMLLKTCHEFLGEEYHPYVMGGGTHARKFPNALPYGPGGIQVENPFGSPHGADEAVHIDSLIRSMVVYVMALRRMDGML